MIQKKSNERPTWGKGDYQEKKRKKKKTQKQQKIQEQWLSTIVHERREIQHN